MFNICQCQMMISYVWSQDGQQTAAVLLSDHHNQTDHYQRAQTLVTLTVETWEMWQGRTAHHCSLLELRCVPCLQAAQIKTSLKWQWHPKYLSWVMSNRKLSAYSVSFFLWCKSVVREKVTQFTCSPQNDTTDSCYATEDRITEVWSEVQGETCPASGHSNCYACCSWCWTELWQLPKPQPWALGLQNTRKQHWTEGSVAG